MPQMADITIKKADGTTNVVYTALSPSAGDKVAAVWRSNTVSNIPGRRPTFSLTAEWNGPRTARRVTALASWAEYDANGVLVGNIPMRYEITLPQGLTDTFIAEAVEQFGNLLAATLVKQAQKDGFAPT